MYSVDTFSDHLLNSARRLPCLIMCVEGLAMARMFGVTQCEKSPSRALSCSTHLPEHSYLQLRPPQKREHCREPAEMRLSLSDR